MYFQLGLAEPDVIAVFYYPDNGDLISNISNNIGSCAFCLNQTCISKCLAAFDIKNQDIQFQCSHESKAIWHPCT